MQVSYAAQFNDAFCFLKMVSCKLSQVSFDTTAPKKKQRNISPVLFLFFGEGNELFPPLEMAPPLSQLDFKHAYQAS